MRNVLPCPKCGAEVEVVRLANKGKERMYRIQCTRCRNLVAKGNKFPEESDADGAKRIAQYEAYIAEQLRPITFRQTESAKERDYIAAHSAKLNEEDLL